LSTHSFIATTSQRTLDRSELATIPCVRPPSHSGYTDCEDNPSDDEVLGRWGLAEACPRDLCLRRDDPGGEAHCSAKQRTQSRLSENVKAYAKICSRTPALKSLLP
jgi:hypothetical protein